jgi:hypothetical protein
MRVRERQLPGARHAIAPDLRTNPCGMADRENLLESWPGQDADCRRARVGIEDEPGMD